MKILHSRLSEQIKIPCEFVDLKKNKNSSYLKYTHNEISKKVLRESYQQLFMQMSPTIVQRTYSKKESQLLW